MTTAEKEAMREVALALRVSSRALESLAALLDMLAEGVPNA
jgi:hypothetical protein